MWSTIANFKENLNQIALEVQDAAEELEIYRSNSSGEDSVVSDRRNSHQFAHSSPLRGGGSSSGGGEMDSRFKSEIGSYKAEIQRLQASEAEIKALSVNYAALLKEKEEQLSKLYEENGSLRQNLETTNAALRASANGHKGSVLKQGLHSNGSIKAIHSDGAQQKKEQEQLAKFQRLEKELADLQEEKRSLAAMQSRNKSEIEKLRRELDKERGSSANIKVKLQEEHKLNEDLQKEVHILKLSKDTGQKSVAEMTALQNELNEKILEIKRLQLELTRRNDEEQEVESAEILKGVIATLEKENIKLKAEKDELELSLKSVGKSLSDKFRDDSDPSNKQSSFLNEGQSSGKFPGQEEMELSLKKLAEDLMKACQERDKAHQDLARLKQHLLDKELEESEKMDEDSKVIEELRAELEYQKAQIFQLEKALQKAIASQEDAKKMNGSELQKSKEIIDDLKKKLTSCMNTIDAKNVELLNLQTALGQYYAESEAKERLERDYMRAREELAKLGELLKESYQQAEVSKQEKGETLDKLSQAEKVLSEGKYRMHKLEEDNAKLRLALEQSMTRLNRMSMDSDYFVDRRIVIKLLVTYFQRNHSKEVLDLMVRMLGFSEEEKQRIGGAQQGGGKGVVRGVLGLPGRFVGGMLGGSSPEGHANVPSENQSFSDLWVDFLLKETEEQKRREAEESNRGSNS